MSRASITRQGRRFMERENMLDTCKVERLGEPDELTGVAPRVLLYSGPCSVETYEGYEQTPEAGGHVFTVQRYILKVPVGSFAPAIGDLATMLTAALDANLVGRELRVVAQLHKTAATAYRLGVTDEVA